MEYRIIKSPSRGTLEILARRKGSGNAVKLEDVDAVGLVQGRLIEMVCAADVAEKQWALRWKTSGAAAPSI